MTCTYCPAALNRSNKSGLCCDHSAAYAYHVRNRCGRGLEPLSLEEFARSKDWREYPQLHQAAPRPKPRYDSARLFTREELQKIRRCAPPERPPQVATKLIVRGGEIVSVRVYAPYYHDTEFAANPVRPRGTWRSVMAHLLPA